MIKQIKILILIFTIFIISSFAHAQKSTELYIPIGQSPGLSHNLTVIGTIIDIDSANTIISVKSGERVYRVKIKPQASIGSAGTWIYVDRSKRKERNDYGYFNHFKIGELIEVKFEYNFIGQPAEWVKVER